MGGLNSTSVSWSFPPEREREKTQTAGPACGLMTEQELVHETFAAHFTKLHECLLQAGWDLFSKQTTNAVS